MALEGGGACDSGNNVPLFQNATWGRRRKGKRGKIVGEVESAQADGRPANCGGVHGREERGVRQAWPCLTPTHPGRCTGEFGVSLFPRRFRNFIFKNNGFYFKQRECRLGLLSNFRGFGFNLSLCLPACLSVSVCLAHCQFHNPFSSSSFLFKMQISGCHHRHHKRKRGAGREGDIQFPVQTVQKGGFFITGTTAAVRDTPPSYAWGGSAAGCIESICDPAADAAALAPLPSFLVYTLAAFAQAFVRRGGGEAANDDVRATIRLTSDDDEERREHTLGKGKETDRSTRGNSPIYLIYL